jgi:hypothetical protein
MSAEITPLGIEKLVADVAVHLVAAAVRRDVLVADLLVHEGFGAAGKGAFERAMFVGKAGVGEVFF